MRSNLRSDFVLLRRLLIELANEERLMVGLVLFFFYFDDQLDLPVKETDRLYWCVRDFCL